MDRLAYVDNTKKMVMKTLEKRIMNGSLFSSKNFITVRKMVALKWDVFVNYSHIFLQNKSPVTYM